MTDTINAAGIVAALVKPPVRCAECNCKRGGSACTWIKGGDEMTHEEYIAAALDVGPIVALVRSVDDVVEGRGMFGADATADLDWALLHLEKSLAAFRSAASVGEGA